MGGASSRARRYKIKQRAIFTQMQRTGNKSPTLSYSRQLELMIPAWQNAFSRETNQRAWREGGFGTDGINMLPLWKQLKKEEGHLVESRALSAAEKTRNAAAKLGLGRTFEFDKWLTNPFEQSSQTLENELDADAEEQVEDLTGVEPIAAWPCCCVLRSLVRCWLAGGCDNLADARRRAAGAAEASLPSEQHAGQEVPKLLRGHCQLECAHHATPDAPRGIARASYSCPSHRKPATCP